MVHAGCVFVASIHPSRTWMSGSFESMQWNACVLRLDLGLYSHPKEGVFSRPVLTPREKSPLSEAQRRIRPTMLHHTGQRAQHTTNWTLPAYAKRYHFLLYRLHQCPSGEVSMARAADPGIKPLFPWSSHTSDWNFLLYWLPLLGALHCRVSAFGLVDLVSVYCDWQGKFYLQLLSQVCQHEWWFWVNSSLRCILRVAGMISMQETKQICR